MHRLITVELNNNDVENQGYKCVWRPFKKYNVEFRDYNLYIGETRIRLSKLQTILLLISFWIWVPLLLVILSILFSLTTAALAVVYIMVSFFIIMAPILIAVQLCASGMGTAEERNGQHNVS